MNITEEFKRLAEEWTEHCQSVIFSSDIYDYLSHPAYRKLTELGEPAVPHIMEQYGQDDLPWGFVLDEITGFQLIENPDSFSPPEVKRRWLEWWEQQFQKTRKAG
ncbi:hypothetical protein QUF72_18865 [Desulfobacterales bacterium HSG2]|nr:hypothetical protein [Desulfobacterales bacterium HSG2]